MNQCGPIIIVDEISRGLVQANRKALFAFPDNLKQQGFGTLAGEIRREKNTIGIPTMLDATTHIFDDMIGQRMGRFRYSGTHGNQFIPQICQAFGQLLSHLRSGETVVWPEEGMVTTENRLHVTAPLLLQGIEASKMRVFEESISITRQSPLSE